MGLTLTTDEKGVKIFKKEGTSKAGKPYKMYSMGCSSKDTNGNYVNGYVDCKFKKGVEVNNKASIVIKNCFPTVEEYQGQKKVRWMITEFDVIDAGEGQADATMASSFVNIPDDIGEELPFA